MKTIYFCSEERIDTLVGMQYGNNIIVGIAAAFPHFNVRFQVQMLSDGVSNFVGVDK